ncbi:MAG: 2-isopropylmalate synthase [Nanoarchaeota archaeon]|nr:2-isopropylmalate synthase [Nanoarchaeota archaeon]
MKKVKIFDTTLRDGEQSPGINLNINEKVMIARQLESLGVDIIEAGFPISSKGSYEAVQEISKVVKGTIICALARTVKKDIEAAAEALHSAEKKRIHVFVATSQIHMDHKLRKNKEEIISMVADNVMYAKSFCEDIEFSPEDASRTDMDFMCKVIETAVDAGATTINIPDTVGYAQPEEYGARIRYVLEHVPNIKGIDISTHCHDDLGLSVANSLAAVKAGANQIEATINGLGERAGNTALEEVVMALKTRKDYYDAYTEINTKELFRTSRLVSQLTGMHVQRNKAIIGQNAFSHQSGIHQHGVIQHKKTYEIMSPEDIGWVGENIFIGKLSGKNAVKKILEENKIILSEDQLKEVSLKIKELSDKEKDIEKDDVIALAIDELNSLGKEEDMIKLDELTVLTGNRITPSSTVVLEINGKKKTGSAQGVGPVDAASKAIKEVVGPFINLKEYRLRAITGGTDALCNVAIKFEDDKSNIFASEAVDEDVIMASVKAIIKGANKAMIYQKKFADNNRVKD